MKLVMPKNADQISEMTGNTKYGRQYKDLKKPWVWRGYSLTVSSITLLHKLELSDKKLKEYSAQRIRATMMRLAPDVLVKDVFFYPLEGRLEIIVDE